jgi:RNA polymerase sigma-70 factor (ECF subfamily)
MTRTPQSLLARLHQPQPPDWNRFIDLYTPLLWHWARRFGLQEQDAADLVQDVFVVLLDKLPQFNYNPAKSFRAWLRTVALNVWRARARATRRLTPLGSPEELDQIADPAEAFWDMEYHGHLARRALQLMQADFEPATWKACWEMVTTDRAAAEIARELHLSVGAVYAAKFRVLARLREELAGMLD